jgi:hypothetical protein
MTAEEASIDRFLSVTARSPYQQQLEGYLTSLLQSGSTKPGWCIVGASGGEPVARAALWTMPDHDVPSDIVLLDVDWDAAGLAVGRALLSAVHDFAVRYGADASSTTSTARRGRRSTRKTRRTAFRYLTSPDMNSCAMDCDGRIRARARRKHRGIRSSFALFPK